MDHRARRITAAFLGAAYWAACVLLSWAALQPDWPRARTALPPVFTIAVLLLVATLIHLDRFHHDLYGRFWLVVYVIVVPLLAYLIWAQPKGARERPAPWLPLVGWLRVALAGRARCCSPSGSCCSRRRSTWPRSGCGR